jgi:hypothetical protein
MQNKTGKLHELQGKIEQIIELEESSVRDYLSMSDTCRRAFLRWMQKTERRKPFLTRCMDVEHHDIKTPSYKWACVEELN